MYGAEYYTLTNSYYSQIQHSPHLTYTVLSFCPVAPLGPASPVDPGNSLLCTLII